MIANEKQYRSTKKLHKEFMEQLLKLQQNQSDDLLNEMHINALQAKIDDFEMEIAEYEALKRGDNNLISVNSLTDIGEILIKARIAHKWSQRELAKAMGMEEQQIQRYETNYYHTTTLPTLQRIAQILGIEFLPIKSILRKPQFNTGSNQPEIIKRAQLRLRESRSLINCDL